ncbi:MAG TPA: histidine kinase dimerization/phospho-acceptor domain-containing protein [Chitinophaga sp.]
MSKPLLQRNTRVLLIWLPVVLLVCSALFYVVLRSHAHHTQEKLLQLKQENVWNAFVARSGNIETHIAGEYDIIAGENALSVKMDQPRDTSVYYPAKKRFLPFQALSSRLQWNGQAYYITTYVSSTEISHLIAKVFATEALILILLLLAIIILNRRSSRRLWQPFFSSMSAVERFDIVRNNQLNLPTQTGTSEFDNLNTVLTSLIANINTAYFQQKQFVENASHEIQTPLAIIRAKIELLINQPNLTEKAAALLGDITDATNRLSQLNRTLLLLAKIENNQFPDTEAVDLSQLLNKTIENCMNHYDDCPEITSSIQYSVIVYANRSLIEILISNLVNNAIVHNDAQRKINIVLEGSKLLIENTGEQPPVPTEVLFERFKKGSHQQKTTGLGLALVKQISQLYHYTTIYEYSGGWHRVSVSFP